MCQQRKRLFLLTLSLLLLLPHVSCSTSSDVSLKDIFTPDSPLTRLPRDGKYSRYSSDNGDNGDKSLRPENVSEGGGAGAASVDKRCIRCDSGYDSYPYRRSPYYRDEYEDRSRDYDRYDDRYLDRDRYYDRDRYDRYSDRSRGGYGGQDRYHGLDRYRYKSPSRYSSQDRYGDRYGDYDHYDPYDRFSDRGVGYDNRGYDYRGSDSGGYRPWDETYRGSSGFDGAGRGYYFATGRPDYGGYASGWNYGNSGSGIRDDYYRDRGYGGYATYRPYRDPYDGYRATSYLYGRPSTTTMKTPSTGQDDGNTPSPIENSG